MPGGTRTVHPETGCCSPLVIALTQIRVYETEPIGRPHQRELQRSIAHSGPEMARHAWHRQVSTFHSAPGMAKELEECSIEQTSVYRSQCATPPSPSSGHEEQPVLPSHRNRAGNPPRAQRRPLRGTDTPVHLAPGMAKELEDGTSFNWRPTGGPLPRKHAPLPPGSEAFSCIFKGLAGVYTRYAANSPYFSSS